MLFKPETRLINLVKLIWVTLCLWVLYLGLALCLANPGSFVHYDVLLFMTLFTFPAGILAQAYLALFIEADTSVLAFVAMWLSMFLAGYVQWFILVSNLSQPDLTNLGLTSSESNKISPNSIESDLPHQRRVRRRRRAPIRAFDSRGRTPLERAIRSNPISH